MSSSVMRGVGSLLPGARLMLLTIGCVGASPNHVAFLCLLLGLSPSSFSHFYSLCEWFLFAPVFFSFDLRRVWSLSCLVPDASLALRFQRISRLSCKYFPKSRKVDLDMFALMCIFCIFFI